VINGFLGECGAYLCPPLSQAEDEKSKTYESFYFRGMLAATIDENTLNFKADSSLFMNGFQRWFDEELPKAQAAGSAGISLMHPLAAFVLHEICQVIDPVIVVVTRPFEQIEKTRNNMKWHETYGRVGAQKIYDQIFSYLLDNTKTFLTISFNDFRNSQEARLKLLDYCDLNVSNSEADAAFAKVLNEKD
jgi:hypothetical protein